MKLGLGVPAGPDPDLLAPLAAEAEALGYASIWSNDHPGGEGLLQLSRWAETSRSIDVCVGVVALDRHTPAAIATHIGELGLPIERLIVGIGAGFDSHPLGSVRAGVGELRELVPGIRLLVAAMGPKMCALAGEVADGVLLNWMTPARVAASRELVLAGAAAAGRDPAEIVTCAYIRTAAGPDAADRLATEAGMYAQMPHYARNFEANSVPPADTGIASDPADLAAKLAEYSALDIAVVRVLSERSMDAILAVARAALDS